jgi:hypothetical protein
MPKREMARETETARETAKKGIPRLKAKEKL